MECIIMCCEFHFTKRPLEVEGEVVERRKKTAREIRVVDGGRGAEERLWRAGRGEGVKFE
jgi:hypothetical protein